MENKRKNIVVLTTGSSGSSVLAGIIGRKGYWLGNETKKLAFDTYENSNLVDLNVEILKASGFDRYDCNDIPSPDIDKIESAADTVDIEPFMHFIKECEAHEPWLWKDPRLSFTIHFWAKIMEFSSDNFRFVFIDRDPLQSYSALILKRKVPMSRKEHRIINDSYRKSCDKFFKNSRIEFHQTQFDSLIVDPVAFLNELNMFLEESIEMEDVNAIYNGKLGKKKYGILDFLEAIGTYSVQRYVYGKHVVFPRRNVVKLNK